MALPNFFLIGVPKAGTTALHHALVQHPDVFMSAHKEPKYFARPEKWSPYETPEQYAALFDDVDGEAAVGEASTDYFHHPRAPERVAAAAPGARAVAVLRDPAERAYSHHAMLVRRGDVPHRPYVDVLRDAMRQGGDWSRVFGTGVRQSLYADGLERWFRALGPERVRVYRYEDLRADAAGLLSDLFAFLGVDPAFQPAVAPRNTSSVPRSPALHRVLRRPNAVRAMAVALVPTPARRAVSAWIHTRNQAPLPPLSAEARALLVEGLRSDVERVEALLGWDLPAWKAP